MSNSPEISYTATAGGVRLRVRLSPRAARNRIDGLHTEADGARALKVAVTAPPEGGKANTALIRLLAKALGVPKGSLSIAVGAKDRRKTIFIQGNSEELIKKLNQKMGV